MTADRPRGRRRDAPALRRLWSLLYRAVRRQAVRVDQLQRAVDALAAGMDDLRARLVALEDARDDDDDGRPRPSGRPPWT